MKYNYEYLRSNYTGSNKIVPFDGELKRTDKISVECSQHGIFSQAISSILNSSGCQKCYFDSKKGKLKYTTDTWIQKSKEIHENFYIYDNSIFKGIEEKITITCPVHGDFEQSAIVHLNGHGCRKCSTDRMIKLRSYDTEKFIEISKKKHNNRYSYEKSVFTGIKNKITITCPEHGDFEQVAYYHTYGNGCPLCGIEKTTFKSAPEYEIIEFLYSLGIQNIKHGSRNLGFELDILLPDQNIAIEYNGLYWHSSNKIENDKEFSVYHLDKTIQCENNGIRLFHIFENEWLDETKKEIWKSTIKNALGLSIKVFARKCLVKEITNKESKEFCNYNHLQGSVNSEKSYGLFLSDRLISVITLGKSRYMQGCIEILRYCNKKNHTVVGGFSKLLSHIEKIHQTDIISYANRRWSNGNLYKKTGFELKNISGPCYFYLDKKFEIYHRSTFTKKKVLKMFPQSTGTEVSIMYENGFRRIWDCGNYVFYKESK